MSTLPATQDDAPAVPGKKRRRIPKKVRAALDFFIAGEVKTVTEAAERAGISRQYLHRQLGRADVSAYLNDQSMRKVALARAKVVGATDQASDRMVELIRADSEHVSFDASREVLAIAGIKSKGDQNISLSIDVKAGFVIDLSEPEESRRKIDVTPRPPRMPRATPADPLGLMRPRGDY